MYFLLNDNLSLLDKFCKWHAEPSACNMCKEIAENDSGYGVGVYRADEVPSLPAHPNCRCGLGSY